MNYEFYVISMKTKNGKTLYLKTKENNYSDKVLCEWCFDYNNAIWFDTINDLENFANKYFKGFNNWNIKTINYSI